MLVSATLESLQVPLFALNEKLSHADSRRHSSVHAATDKTLDKVLNTSRTRARRLTTGPLKVLEQMNVVVVLDTDVLVSDVVVLEKVVVVLEIDVDVAVVVVAVVVVEVNVMLVLDTVVLVAVLVVVVIEVVVVLQPWSAK